MCRTIILVPFYQFDGQLNNNQVVRVKQCEFTYEFKRINRKLIMHEILN